MDVVGFEGFYKVSNLGRIKSLYNRYHKGEIILKNCFDSAGYVIVMLCKDNIRFTKTVHRLVAESFLGKSELHVNHKDGNKSNNNIENIEFVTMSQNTRHAIENGLFKPNIYNIAIKSRKKVVQKNFDTNEKIAVYESAHEASRRTGINRGNICSVCRGEDEFTGGYKWEYETI